MGLVLDFEDGPDAGNDEQPGEPCLLFPFEFDRFRVLRLLGWGGMGAAYEAEESENGRRVAMKVLRRRFDAPEERERFFREARSSALLNHPNCVYTFETAEIEGRPIITMEFVTGGTLHDRLAARGPLPIGETVDAILQIVTGLEAAHAAGILHRDIKPTNCFVGADGTVKVGDFGLAVRVIRNLEAPLTERGTFVGTFEISSPEYIHEGKATIYSDIYSVGATLFCLLTGTLPFRSEASVMVDPPPSPGSLRPDLPEQLARVVLRCLAKKPQGRYATYDDLRNALLPFASIARPPASLARRFVAGLIDMGVLMLPDLLLPTLAIVAYALVTHRVMPAGLRIFGATFTMATLDLMYFAVSERLWGATMGKALLGMRVSDHRHNVPGFSRALLRSVIFLLPIKLALLPFLIQFSKDDVNAGIFLMGVAFVYLYPALLCLTCRQRNGWATVTDLCTGTRVVLKNPTDIPLLTPGVEAAEKSDDTRARIGPYQVLRPIKSTEDERILLGWDPQLQRSVWIRQVAASAPSAPSWQRKLSRPGRLHWLQGGRNEKEAWDAFDFASGASFVNLVRTRQPWEKMRRWLYFLAAELDAAAADGSLPMELRLDHLWVTSAGQVRLLDFCAPDIDQPIQEAGVVSAGVFLNQAALSALRGSLVGAEEALRENLPIWTGLTAVSVMAGIRASPPGAALAPQYQQLLKPIANVSRRRRLVLAGGVIGPGLFICLFGFAIVACIGLIRRAVPALIPMKSALYNYAQMKEGHFPFDVDPSIGLEPVEIFIADRFARELRDPNLPWLSPAERADAAEILAAHPVPTPEEAEEAVKKLGPAVDHKGVLAIAWLFRDDGEDDGGFWVGAVMGSYLWPAFITLGCALLFRGGPLMHSLGVAVVKKNGQRASNGRVFWRACVAWSLLPISFVVFVFVAVFGNPTMAAAVVSVLVIGAVIVSLALPNRSLHDRIAGTWLTPR